VGWLIMPWCHTDKKGDVSSTLNLKM